jgi:hypothetical protein
MTDAMLPPDDELVSAVLDGEATPEERARVEADPAAQERLARFAEARRQIATPVTVPSEARERAIAAALGAFDAASSTPPPAPWAPVEPAAAPPRAVGGAPATAPSDELAARRNRPGRGLRLLAAAAAVVVVLIGVGAVIQRADQGEQVATSAPASQDADNSDRAQPERAPSADVDTNEPAVTTTRPPGAVTPTAPTTTSSPTDGAEPPTAVSPAAPLVELGSIATTRELRTAVLAGIDEQASSSRPDPSTAYEASAVAGGPAFVSCADQVHAADPEIGGVLLSAEATYQGRPAIVLAFAIDRAAHPAANGSVRIYALDAATCATRSVQTVR